MPTAFCKGCDKPFEKTRSNLYCNRKCRNKYHSNNSKEKRIKGTTHEVKKEFCKYCFSPFIKNNNRCFCSDVCAYKNRLRDVKENGKKNIAYKECRRIIQERKIEQGKCATPSCSCTDIRLFDLAHFKREEKSYDIGHGHNVEKTIKELAKARFLCVICHRIETYNENVQIQLKRDPSLNTSDYLYQYKRKDKLRAYVNNIKLSIGACELCDKKVIKDMEFIFDFDHLKQIEKTKAVSEMIGSNYSKEEIDKEIKLCRLLCCNCHRIYSLEQTSLCRLFVRDFKSLPLHNYKEEEDDENEEEEDDEDEH